MNSTLNGRFELNGASKKTSKSKVSKSKSKSNGRKLNRGEKIRASAFFALACAGLTVSLPHLASEVRELTGSAALAAWFLAIVIDLGMIATKAHISAHGANRRTAWTIVSACTFVSIALNCHAFLANAVGTFGAVAAVGFGTFLPLFIVALSFMGSEILNGRK